MKLIFGQKYYTIEDLATEFGKSGPTIYRWISEGKLKGKRCGNQTLFTEEDVQNFINALGTGGADVTPNTDSL